MRSSLLLALASLLVAPLSAQSTWFVDAAAAGPGTGSSTDPYPAISDAVDAPTTLSGDLVLIRPGTYQESVDLAGKTLRLASEGGPDVTTIDASGSGRPLTVRSGEGPGTECVGLTLRAGRAARGGGVFVDGAALRLEDCVIVGCSSNAGGGGVYATATGTVEAFDVTIRENSTRGDGGGVLGPVRLVDCLVQRNRSEGDGGGVAGPGARLEAVTLVDNAAGTAGLFGQLHPRSDGGGAIDCALVNCSVGGNQSSRFGGGLARCVVSRSTVGFNRIASTDGVSVVSGGGVFECDVTDSSLTGNIAYGIRSEGCGAARSTLVNCTVQGSTMYKLDVRGVGTYDCDLTDCTVRNNRLSGSFSAGIGVFGGTARGCRIYGNATATFVGTGVPLGGDIGPAGGGAANARLERCAIYGNTAREAAGILSCTAHQCTIYGNVGLNQVGAAAHTLSQTGDRTTLRNCVVWENGPWASETVLPGPGVEITYSIVEGGYPGVGNLAQAPQLTAPRFLEFVPLEGSPCIDAGDPTSAPDPDGTRADIGVAPFEAGACAGPWVDPACGNAPTTVSGAVSASGATEMMLTVETLTPGDVGVTFLSLERGNRYLLGVANVCVVGALTLGPSIVADPSGTARWTVAASDIAATGAVVGSRIHAQAFFPTGPWKRLSRMVETTVCP